jgi:hypothetical protein
MPVETQCLRLMSHQAKGMTNAKQMHKAYLHN